MSTQNYFFKWKIRKYIKLLVLIKRILLFIYVYSRITIDLLKNLNFRKLYIRESLKYFSVLRFLKLYRIYFLCTLHNFESDLKTKSKLIVQITKALASIKVPNLDTLNSEDITSHIKLNGWIDSRFLPIINFSSGSPVKLKSNLKRRDVAISKGKENLFSGFKIIIDAKNVRDVVWEVPTKNNPAIKGLLYPSSDTAKKYFYNIQGNLNQESDLAGHIDDIKFFWSSSLVFENLDFLFFTNMVTGQKLDFVLRYIDHNVLDTLFALISKTNPDFLDMIYLNTAAVKKLVKYLPASRHIEFFDYRVQNGISPRMWNLTNARLVKGKFVIDQNGILVNEFSDSLNSDLVAGVNHEMFCDLYNESVTGFFNSSKHISINNAIVLPSLANSNWFHFIVESLAVLIWFEDKLPRDIPLLVCHDVPNNVIQFLNLFGFVNIVFINPNIEVRVDNLITFSKSAIIVDSVMSDLNSFQINSELLLNLRERIANFFSISHGFNDMSELYFFPRKKTSRSLILNSKSFKLFNKLGFESIFIGDYPVKNQIFISSKCDKVAMEGGASMSSFLYFKSSCKILYFTNELLESYNLPKYFGSIFDLDVQIVTGKLTFSSAMKATSKYNLFHSNYSMPFRRLKKLLIHFVKY
jgi:hypothetical protein